MTVPSQLGASSLLLLASGFGLWTLAFATLYGMLSIGCAFGWQEVELAFGLTLQRLQLVVLFFLFLLAHVGLLFKLKARARPAGETAVFQFIWTGSFLANAAALAASAFTFVGVFVLNSCRPYP